MRKIKLSQGKVALIDNEDFDNISQYRWYVFKGGNNFYACKRTRETTIIMHRRIMGAKKGQIVDHINGDGLDNRKKNLRFVTKSQNQWNRHSKGKGVSKYIGVHWYKRRRLWVAQMMHDGKYLHLGFFKKEKDAAIAYDESVRKYRGEYGRTNF